MNQETIYWHRIEMVCYAPPVDEFDNPTGRGTVGLTHHRFKVVKTTPKGVWIDVGGWDLMKPDLRFVRLDAKRQWASPTFEQAKAKFARRKGRQIEILKNQIRDIQEALEQVETFKPHDDTPGPGYIP